MTTTAANAIDRSTSHSEIVTIHHTIAGDHEYLRQACDGWTDAGWTDADWTDDSHRITEYWGSGWRVHTIGR